MAVTVTLPALLHATDTPTASVVAALELGVAKQTELAEQPVQEVEHVGLVVGMEQRPRPPTQRFVSFVAPLPTVIPAELRTVNGMFSRFTPAEPAARTAVPFPA